MPASFVALVSGLAMIGSGAVAFLARRAKPVGLALFALLALWGVATMASASMTGADTIEEASVAARLTVWYSLPLPALTLATLAALMGRPSVAVVVATAALATLAGAGAALFALDASTFIQAVRPFADGYNITAGPLHYALTATTPLVAASLAILGASRARRADAPRIERDRAALIALATALVPLHAAGFFATYVLAPTDSLSLPLFWARAIPTLLAGAFAGAALLALGRSRRRLLGAGAFALALGMVDGVAGAQISLGAAYPGYERNVVLVRLAFALLISLVALRFGLADVGASGRRLVARGSAGVLGLLAGALATGLSYVALGATPIALGVGLALGAAAPLAARAPLATAGRAFGARLLLAPDDPRAIAERARTYAAAVAAANGAGEEGASYLAGLREDLGISEREHELLAQGLASRDASRYQPVEVLGAGSTAQVELALDEVGGRRVVVKRFKGLRDPAAALREARALAAVRHPRVVPFLEVDRRDDEVFLVLAHAEGGSARQLLDKEGPLPPARAVALTLDLLDGLDALHRQGIVHCDVKPENLLLDRDGRGLIGDFGSARFRAPDLADATLTGAEGSLSTVSPEALRGAPPAPARDVYAAGALLYRLLTGQHYVDLADATVFEARERITLDAPRLPHPKVPIGVEAVLRKALAKRASERYQSAGEMREALAGALARAA